MSSASIQHTSTVLPEKAATLLTRADLRALNAALFYLYVS
jgi:hypothetical protein